MAEERQSGAWWDSFYTEAAAELFLVRSAHELEGTLGFLCRHLELDVGSVVFDQCCGIGSVSIPLAARGMEVYGADLHAPYIDRAQKDAKQAGSEAQYVCADAFVYLPPKPCDGVFNWYSSFGYAPTEADNQVMLQRAFEALRPGGKFAMDILNVAGVIHNFQGCTVRRGELEEGEVLLLRESTLDLPGGRLKQRWTYVMPGGETFSRDSSVALYLPHQIESLLCASGFVDVEFFGDMEDNPVSLHSRRCVCVARKPGQEERLEQG